MQSRKLALGLAVLAAFMVVDSALAYYNPSTGRFINRDPVGESGARMIQAVAARAGTGFIPRDPMATGNDNLYAFVRNSPPNLVDPDGQLPLDLINEGLRWATVFLCPFPPAPTNPPATGDGWGRPPDIDVWNPWLRWVIARRGEEYYISPTSSFGKYVLGLKATAGLESTANANIARDLVSHCDCGSGNCDAKEIFISGRGALHASAPYEEWQGGDWGPGTIWSFGMINGIHMNYSARCNIRSCCTHCKATCLVDYDVFDSFHWDINPIARGPLYERGFTAYWWHVVYQKVKQFVVPCPKG
ncbi:MAG: hypothetical protein IPM13_00520 [Phycisphaerales bacterium]|nr:hypothetical protein [Phycisphaerales bacterium]